MPNRPIPQIVFAKITSSLYSDFQFYVSFCQLSTWAISNFSVLTTIVLQRDSVTMRESAGTIPILASTSSHGKRKPVHRMESDSYGREIDGYSGPSR
jgi:hypothetical protein